MPVNQEKLTAALEAVASGTKPGALAAVASIAAETVGAREFGLLTIELDSMTDPAGIHDVTIHAGALRSETMKRQVHARAGWWGRQPFQTAGPVLPQLLQADPDHASDAFRFAREPLISPKASALCVFEKTQPKSVTAFVADDMESVPPVADQLVFHSLAGLLLTLARVTPRDTVREPRAALSPRERECLLWSARGKTSFEIARILDLSEHTVNHYLVNTVTKLDAANRAHAIVTAMVLGIIPISDV